VIKWREGAKGGESGSKGGKNVVDGRSTSYRKIRGVLKGGSKLGGCTST